MTTPCPRIARRAALALLPALAACGTTTVQPLAQPPRGRVVVLRGLLNMFSTGMNVLTFTLREAGYDATVHNHAEWRGLANRTAEAARGDSSHAARGDSLKRPLAVIGHSFGADDAIAMAGRLGAADVPVDLLVTFDPSWVLAVPRGPRRVINFHQDRDTYARRLSPGPGFDGRIENREVSGQSHLSIDKDLDLHRQVLAALREIDSVSGPPGSAAAVPATVAPAPMAGAAPPPRPAPLPRPPAAPVRAAR